MAVQLAVKRRGAAIEQLMAQQTKDLKKRKKCRWQQPRKTDAQLRQALFCARIGKRKAGSGTRAERAQYGQSISKKKMLMFVSD